MQTASNPAPLLITRRELLLAILGSALAATLFLGPQLFSGRYMSADNIVNGFEPWSSVFPRSGPERTNDMLFDSPLQFDPWHYYTSERLHEGQLPLWNPYNYLGAPFAANIQAQVFYPLAWPSYLTLSGALIVVPHWLTLFFAVLGMYVFARITLGLSPLASSIAALAFGYEGQLIVWLLAPLSAVMSWLPWLWWAVARLIDRPSGRRFAALAVIVGLLLLAGHPESAYDLAVATALFVLFYLGRYACREIEGPWSGRLRVIAARVGLLAGAGATGLLLSAVGLLPFAEYLSQSAALATREGGAYDGGLPFNELWTLVGPDWFGNPANHDWWGAWNYNESNVFCGVLPLLLAPFALLSRRAGHRLFSALMWLLVAFAMIMAYQPPVLYSALLNIPLMGHGLTHRFIFLIPFALGLLAAIGLDAIQERLAGQRRLLIAGIVAVLAFWFAVGVGVPWLTAQSFFKLPADSSSAHVTWQNSMWRAVILLAVSGLLLLGAVTLSRRRQRWSYALLALLPLLLWADVWQAHGGYMPTVKPQDYFPATQLTDFLQQQPGPFRVVAAQHTLLQNTNLMYSIQDLRGYDAVEPLLYRQLVQQFEPNISGTLGGWLYLFEGKPSPLWNLLNVRYVMVEPGEDTTALKQAVGTGPLAGQPRFQRVLKGGDTGASVYENKAALPRAWLVHSAQVVADQTARLKQLAGSSFDPTAVALLDAPLPADNVLPASPVSASSGDQITVTNYQPEHVVISASSGAAGLLVFGDMVYPGWHATVDGIPAPIITADHALRAVYLPAGQHNVRFDYAPASLTWGSLLTLAGLLVVALSALWPWSLRNKSGAS